MKMNGFRKAFLLGLLLPPIPIQGEQPPPMNPADHQAFADRLTANMYSEPNECSSALGISMAFSLIYPGTTGEAIDQVRDAMGFPDGANAHRQLVWEEITEELLSDYGGQCLDGWGDVCYVEAPLLKIANSVWFDDDAELSGEYEGIVGEYLQQIDFDDEESPTLVNQWVSDSTDGLIDSIVEEGKPLFPPLFLLAVNSIYLKAGWEDPFEEYNTNLDSFYDSPSGAAKVSDAHFMNAVEYFDYSHTALPGYQVIRLPFAFADISMVFVLPTLDILQNVVPSTMVLASLDGLEPTRVALSLPKFKFESEYNDGLIESLRRLGIDDPFETGTKSLCGIFEDEDACRSLVVDKVVQKTVIDVNEKGVEAAAVSAVGVSLTSIGPRDENAVTLAVLDHPFQFLIYDEGKGLALFEGRVGAPEVPRGAPDRPLYDAERADGDFWTSRFGVDPVAPVATGLGEPSDIGETDSGDPDDGCREGDCRNPLTGACAGVASCLVDPCEATEKCGAASCTSNFCGACHAVCGEDPGVPVALGGECQTGPAADKALSCGKGAFCQLKTGVCDESDAPKGACSATTELCNKKYDPVCGCDGETYSNECMAHEQGVSVSYVGECKKPEPTISITLGDECEYGPVNVCGKGAFCQLETGVCDESGAPKGVCSATTELCNKKYDPVCGCDGKTHGNECEANMAGVSVSYVGECTKAAPTISITLGDECVYGPADACGEGSFCLLKTGVCDESNAPKGACSATTEFCTEQYDPVCGCDGETHSNECKAHEQGVSVSYAGECKAKTANPAEVVPEIVPNPLALGEACGYGPVNACGKGAFCQLETGVCDESDAPKGVCSATTELCDTEYDPVCGCDGKTHSNECEAHSAGISVSYVGECTKAEPTISITLGDECEYGPANTCGEGNFCLVETGECDESDAPRGACSATTEFCTEQYDPVCGCDEKTYSNECKAHEQGVSVSYAGECKAKTAEVVPEIVPNPLALGEACGYGPVNACGKGAFCQLETGVCDESDAPKGVCSATTELCDTEYDPVCGCDGETHSNECEAHSAGVSVSYVGECTKAEPTISITLGDKCEYGPANTCGEGNFCLLETGKCDESDAPRGACSATTEFCTEQYDPVCGCDKKTYSNECKAHEQGVSVSYTGECKRDGSPEMPTVTMDSIDPAKHQLFADELTRAIYFNDNECSSALGVSMAFSLIYPGSTEEGLEEIRDTLYFPSDNMQLVWEETTQRMIANADGEDLGYAAAPLLSIANSVWLDKERDLDKGYQSVVGDYAIQTEFADEGSPYQLNEWVRESTNGLIDSIVPEDKPLYPPYVLIAINSIYLKATWGLQFQKRRTNLDSFYDSFSGTAEVSEAHFMHMVDYFKYSHDVLPGYQVTSLPFEASEMSMILVLPLSDDSEAVSSSALIAALGDLRRTRVALALPKFKFESEYDEVLKDGLFEMGVAAPFTEGAGALCGLFEDKNGCEGMYLGKVVQKTVIDVNEEGVEAAAVTALGVGITSAPSDDPVTVMLDHPFQFFIYDESEGVTLFEGRVGAPEVPEDKPAEPLMESKHSDVGFWLTGFGVVPAAPPAYATSGKGESVVSSTPPAEAIGATEAAVGGGESVVSSTMPVETVDPTEAAALSTTQPTEVASTSTTQFTEATAASNTATEPTEPALLDPDPSSGNISSNRSFSLCACVFLALHLVFAR